MYIQEHYLMQKNISKEKITEIEDKKEIKKERKDTNYKEEN